MKKMNRRKAAALREFVRKWEMQLFRGEGISEDSAFAADCEAMGFSMDCDDSLRIWRN